jgi:type VI protein secretion system component Hcp
MIGDNFMWFPEKSGSKVSGETSDDVFSKKKAFELKSFTFTMSSDEATEGKGSTTNSSAGKAKFGAFKISKLLDSASVPLYKACSQGTIFPSIMVGVRRSGGAPLVYLQYIFRYNQITGITWSGGTGQERPTEDITISFKAMGVQYIPQKYDGSEGTAQQWSWNTTDQGTPTLDIKGIEPAPSFLTGSGNG